MKKLLFAVLLCTAAPAMVLVNSQPAYARSGGNGGLSIPASQVPKAVKKNFHQLYPAATEVQWEYNPPVYYGTASYVAGYKVGVEKWEATFNASGVFLFAVRKA